MGNTSSPNGNIHWFSTTRWSLVVAAADSQNPAANAALAELCERYWYPLYVFVRRRGLDADAAEDLTQSFFAHFLEKNAFKVADPKRGRFRSFLLASMRNYLADEYHKQRAKKRGGGTIPLSLDFEAARGRYRHEPTESRTPEELFARRWALTQLDQALARMSDAMTEAGERERYELLKDALVGGDVLPYKDVAGALGISEGAVKVGVHRMRKRFGEILRDEIAQTVADPEQIDDELRNLLRALR